MLARPFRLLIASVLILQCVACANMQPAAPKKTAVIPAGREDEYANWHYAPAMKVGDTVIVSGITAHGEGSYEQKIRGMFETAKKTLEAAGASMTDVVEINTYHVNPKDTDSFWKEFQEFSKVHHEYFPDNYPAWTAVGTTALLSPDAPVEMRLVAVIGSGGKRQ